MRVRKKPIVVEAMQVTIFKYPEVSEWVRQNGGEIDYKVDEDNRIFYFIVKTLEGDMQGKEGDWIIKGIKKEFYPCQKEIFEETYQKNFEEDIADSRLKTVIKQAKEIALRAVALNAISGESKSEALLEIINVLDCFPQTKDPKQMEISF